MSVQPGVTYKRYAANGVTTVFTIPFLLLDASDLQITLDGVLVTSGFTLTNIGNPTSTCTFTAPPTGDLLFQQMIPFQRLNDYQINGDLLSETVNRDLDRLWLAIKQINRDSGRAFTVSPLEPEGIPPLPVKGLRASKVLAFDAFGDPVTSNLTLAQIEEQPALAVESAQAAAASAIAASSSESSASSSAAAAAASAASVDGRAGRFFGEVVMLPNRNSSPNGVIKADGQLISNALAQYPAAVADLQSGTPSVPVTTPALWLSDPTKRLCWAYDSVANQIRVPDWNGKSAGSLGPAFFRGDGSLGFATGTLRQDQIQNISGTLLGRGYVTVGGNGALLSGSGAFSVESKGGPSAVSLGTLGGSNANADLATFNASLVARTGTETFPTHGVGVWGVVLFGSVSNPGLADAAVLATSYANQQAQLNALDAATGFAYVYFNGGSEGSPVNVAINSRYEVANPFGDHPVICVPQFLYNGEWETCTPAEFGTTTASYGVLAAGRRDKIVARTGSAGLLINTPIGQLITTPTYPASTQTALPCRAQVWRLKG
ncbi:hypothetical protein CS390_16120 [Pseudomonas sp. HLS-6]|uniref:hypothetical protein n=1 Tax=Pseudomonas sp. HLS-6 TaxID=2049589 RepID=UPI000C19B86D|nr:hypothetical protein [Pseudomonas sp. HLS-6]ATR83956.1 hypothetical protein CS390_16120 [Pseudomonas sp. HLS-6]